MSDFDVIVRFKDGKLGRTRPTPVPDLQTRVPIDADGREDWQTLLDDVHRYARGFVMSKEVDVVLYEWPDHQPGRPLARLQRPRNGGWTANTFPEPI